ncbi:MAG: DUF2249 domain-containing protein [Firmicutes bacterium]|nr:DUF2249 domain-containing protein [Bacillota bacterium]
MGTIQVDVRSLAPAQRHSTIMERFHSLKPGQAMELINDHEPKPLYYQFQAEYPDTFDWEYLEEGPEDWRVKITKK